MANKKPINIALLGCGTVGGGVIRLIRDNPQLEARIGAPIEVKHVLVRDSAKVRVPECRKEWLTTDPEQVLGDESLDIVVEVIGKEHPTLGYVERALRQGVSVVSANKFMLAKHGPDLLRLASAHAADLAFEASVGGGIPIIRTLREGLTSDSIDSIHGILNGTCNYILSKMRAEGASFEGALADAQRLGYAEADPAMDVDGHDAMQKVVVLSMLAFGARLPLDQIHVEGIRSITAADFAYAERFGFTIKHLAIARPHVDPSGQAMLEVRVHPTMIPVSSVLANINDVLNGAYIVGRALGPCLLMGPGAGALPTAVSVVADIIDVARARLDGTSGSSTGIIRTQSTALLPRHRVLTRFYLRFDVLDTPGVLATIATALGDEGVSVEQMLQDGRALDDSTLVSVVIVTHTAPEGSVQRALQRISSSGWLKGPPQQIRIEDL